MKETPRHSGPRLSEGLWLQSSREDDHLGGRQARTPSPATVPSLGQRVNMFMVEHSWLRETHSKRPGCRIHTEQTAVYPGSAEGWQRGTCRGWKAEVEQLRGPEVVGSGRRRQSKGAGGSSCLTRPLGVLQLSAAADPRPAPDAWPPAAKPSLLGSPWVPPGPRQNPRPASQCPWTPISFPDWFAQLCHRYRRVPLTQGHCSSSCAPATGSAKYSLKGTHSTGWIDSVMAPIPTTQPDGTLFKGRPVLMVQTLPLFLQDTPFDIIVTVCTLLLPCL